MKGAGYAVTMREQIEELALRMGACDVGFCKADDFKEGFENGVSIVVKLSDEVLREISDKPTHSYFHHYRTVNTLIDQCLLQIGILLEKNGYRYLPVGASQSINTDGNPYQGRYSHKKAACLAGLGTIGKNVLFLHRVHGPKVRLGTLFTDCDLQGSHRFAQNTCGSCDICASVCPAMAIPHVKEYGPGELPVLDARACSEYMQRQFKMIGRGAVCGICLRYCPKAALGRPE